MAALSEPVKAFIVKRLACFDRPQEVADAVGEEFNVKIDRRQVEEYDPEKRCKTKKWVELHAATRKAFRETGDGLAITHRSWRQRELEDMARRAKKAKNYKLAAELLEQAAKEDGGYYLNRQRPGEAPAESEELRVERMRAQFDAMDAATLGTTPPGAPQLVVSNGAAA